MADLILTEKEQAEAFSLYQKGEYVRVRLKSQEIWLRSKGYKYNEIAGICNVCEMTLSLASGNLTGKASQAS